MVPMQLKTGNRERTFEYSLIDQERRRQIYSMRPELDENGAYIPPRSFSSRLIVQMLF